MKTRALSLFLALCMVLTMAPMAFAAGYTDTEGHWAEGAIDRWSEYGIVEGIDGLFDPNGQLTRAQLAAIIARLLNLPQAETAGFNDTEGHWAEDVINRCAAAGIMKGDGVSARPDDTVSREETMVMLGRALGIKPVENADLSAYGDNGDVSDWAVGYVAALTEAGIVNGVDGNLSPDAEINRAATMTILDRAITTYVTEPGTTVEANGGIIVVAAEDVTITGEADAVVITEAAAEGTTKLENADVGTVTVQAADTSVVVGQNSTAGSVEMTKQAAGTEVEVAKGATVGTVTTAAPESTVAVSGTVGTVETTETAANTKVEAAAGSTVTNVDNKADGTTVSGAGKVENVTTSGNNTTVNTNGTKVEATEGTTGTTAGNQTVTGGSTSTTTPSAPSVHTCVVIKTEVTAPTCTEKGYTTYTTCCGYNYVKTYVDALGHDFTGAWKKDEIGHWHICAREGCNVTDSKVSHVGLGTNCAVETACEICGYVKVAGEHTWNDGVVTINPSCSAPGVKTFTCLTNDCGATRTDSVNALGHEYTTYESNGDATCTEDGTKTANCDNGCSTTDTVTDEGSKLGHKYTKYESNGDATCTEDGTKTAQCDNSCGTTDTLADDDSALGHKWSEDWVCNENGTHSRVCSNDANHIDTESCVTAPCTVCGDDTVYVVSTSTGVKYVSLEAALNAVEDGETITLLYSEGDEPISMAGSLYGNKTVTITGTATVDWSKGFLFIGRGGEGNGTVIFDEANLTSASNSASYGIHVSGREKGTNNKYDGTVEIKNSTIVLDYLINKGTMELDNSTLTVKNGFSVGGRPASETESGEDATAYMNLTNGSKLIVNNHNGMGLGYEAIGVMNVTEGSTFECTQAFLVTTKGTMNVNGGTLKIAGTLTNNGLINVNAGESTLNIADLSGNEIELLDGAIIKSSIVGGDAYVVGRVTFQGNNEFNNLYDYGDYYYKSGDYAAPAEWTVAEGASVTLKHTVGNAYGLGYGDKVTINGNLTDASTARATLTEGQYSFYAEKGVRLSTSSGNDGINGSFFTINNAYAVIGNSGSFSNSKTNGKFAVAINNSVIDAAQFYFSDSNDVVDLTIKDSDVLVSIFMTEDADSKYTIINSKVVTTGSGNDRYNGNGGTLSIVNSDIEVKTGTYKINGTLTIDTTSSLSAPSISGAGKIVIDAAGYKTGDNCPISGDVSSFTGTIEVINGNFIVEIVEDRIVLKQIVAQVGETLYTDLQAAINEANDGAEIDILGDVALTAQDANALLKPAYNRESYCGVYIPDDKAITLDLNGHIVSYVDTYVDCDNLMIINLGNLTINDSVGGGVLTYKAVAGTTTYSKFYSTIFNCGTLTVNGGTIENTCETETDVTNAVDNHSRLSHEYGNDCILTVNGGTLSGAYYYAIRQYTHYYEGVQNRVTINNGTINGGIYMQHGDSWYYANPSANRLNVDCYLTINGGTFGKDLTPDDWGLIKARLNNPDNNAFGLKINGGTFGVPVEIYIQRGVFYTNGVSGATTPAESAGARNEEWLEKNGGFITGGTFIEDYSDYCANDYTSYANGDGTYTVVAVNP